MLLEYGFFLYSFSCNCWRGRKVIVPLRTECCDLEGGLHALAFQSPRTAEAFFHTNATVCEMLSVGKLLLGVWFFSIVICSKDVPITEGERRLSLWYHYISEAGLRRSPRIRQLTLNRTHSGVFCSTVQPSSQNSQQVHWGQEEESCTQQDVAGTKLNLSRLILVLWKGDLDTSKFDLIWFYERLWGVKSYYVMSSVGRINPW